MSPSQKTMWERAVWVLNRNSITATITVEPPRGRSGYSRRLVSRLPPWEKEGWESPTHRECGHEFGSS
jgi:hypothetical protein